MLPIAPPQGDLAAFRVEIDQIDDALHDLLMRRAEIVGLVGASAAKSGTAVALRPGREAAIIRRLLARHAGRLPPQALVRLWRELLAATTAMQRPFLIAVATPDLVAVAREQFGGLTPLRIHPGPNEALDAVARGAASVAVLPLPRTEEPAASHWWTRLLRPDEPRLHVVGRLPFWEPRVEGAPGAEALVAAAVAPDPSGHDRSLIAMELSDDDPPGRLSADLRDAALLTHSPLVRHNGRDGVVGLVEVEGFVTESDPRLGRLGGSRQPCVLGAYPIPVTGAGS